MKQPLIVEPAEQPLTQTPMQRAIAEYTTACEELAIRRTEAKNLRVRIRELDNAIADLQKSVQTGQSLASLSIDQIRSLSASKAATYAEIAGLQSALDIAESELKDLEDDRATRIWVDDAKPVPWGILYTDLLKTIDLDAIEKLVAVASMGRIGRQIIVNDLGIELAPNAEIIETLAETMGLPL